MAVVGLLLFFATLFVWIPAAAIYFDASERGQSPYLWAILAFVPWLNVIVIVAYLVMRMRTPSSGGVEASTRLAKYLHISVLTYWGLSAFGISVALYAVIHYLRLSRPLQSFDSDPNQALREQIALALSILVIALPALAVHGVLLRRLLARAVEATRSAIDCLQDALSLLLIVLGGTTAALAVVLLVFEVIGRLLRVETGSDDITSSIALAMLPSSTLTILAAWALRRDREVEVVVAEG